MMIPITILVEITKIKKKCKNFKNFNRIKKLRQLIEHRLYHIINKILLKNISGVLLQQPFFMIAILLLIFHKYKKDYSLTIQHQAFPYEITLMLRFVFIMILIVLIIRKLSSKCFDFFTEFIQS